MSTPTAQHRLISNPRTRRHAELRVLLVEDEMIEARLVKANLDRQGRVDVHIASSGHEALDRLRREPYDAVVTDLTMPGMDGIELVRRIREQDSSLPVFIVTAYATLEKAVEGIRAGATDFLPKPINVDTLMALIDRAVAERPLREEIATRLQQRERQRIEERLVGDHARLDEVRRFAQQIAKIPTARILITGESGTGKSLLARVIHDLSGSTGRFIEINCAALPAGLLESELFGHEKGAFTDARDLKRGLIELAHQGTLLLDEIGAMPIELQGKLLLFLENQEIRRIGGTDQIPIRTRVIAATNEDLHDRVRQRAFRQDLLYRLDVAAVEIPPLREMPSVIPQLAERFARDLAADFARSVPELTADSFAELTAYSWPGNARELRNAIERALIFHEEGPFRVRPPVVRDSVPDALGMPYGLSLEELERLYMRTVLEKNRERPLEEVARTLGISRKTLWEKRRKYGL